MAGLNIRHPVRDPRDALRLRWQDFTVSLFTFSPTQREKISSDINFLRHKFLSLRREKVIESVKP